MENLQQITALLFPDEAELNKTPSQKFDDEIRQKIFEMKNQRLSIVDSSYQGEILTNDDYKEIADFLRKHVESVGREQAMKDMQLAFNLLCNSKKNAILEELKILEEDGDFGKKTFVCLKHVCRHYSIDVIKEYLRLGAMNNAIFETQKDNNVDTKKLVEDIRNNLSLKGVN